MNKTLRERYFANEVLKIGDIVEDSDTGESLKIIDRGSNYITVDGPSGVVKKWLNEVKAETEETNPDFSITESGQIKLFGYETKNFDVILSEFILEQFSEFEDLYSKHQIIKLLDRALSESDINKQYELLEKVTHFYVSKEIDPPIIIEGMKNDLERRRIVEILATIADSPISASAYQTAMNAMIALRKKYTQYAQWQVLWPFLQLAKDAGISGITQNLPFSFGATNINKGLSPKKGVLHEELVQLLEDNFEELLASANEETYKEGEAIKEPGLNKSPSSLLQAISKKIAETLVQQKLLNNLPQDEEADENRRKSLVAKLTHRLLPKAREIKMKQLDTMKPADTADTAPPLANKQN